jgi:hypothetical protein
MLRREVVEGEGEPRRGYPALSRQQFRISGSVVRSGTGMSCEAQGDEQRERAQAGPRAAGGAQGPVGCAEQVRAGGVLREQGRVE